jgi:uncharacterized membrane protein
MFKFRGVHYLLCAAMVCAAGGLFAGGVAFAAQNSGNNSIALPPGQEEESPPEEEPKESVDIFAQFPVLENTAGSSFNYEVTIDYRIKERMTFDLSLVLPTGWNGTPRSSPEETAISAFEPEPSNLTEKVIVEVWPVNQLPEPGEYTFTFQVSAGEIQDSIDLKGIVVEPIPRYSVTMSLPTDSEEIQAKAGEENHVSVMISNTATGDLQELMLSADAPDGWQVTFTPNSLDDLESSLSQEIDVSIMPPTGTEAGDYPLVLKTDTEKASTDLELRVTVPSSTAWGGIGIGIAAGVIAGLIIWFRRMGRR